MNFEPKKESEILIDIAKIAGWSPDKAKRDDVKEITRGTPIATVDDILQVLEIAGLVIPDER